MAKGSKIHYVYELIRLDIRWLKTGAKTHPGNLLKHFPKTEVLVFVFENSPGDYTRLTPRSA